MNTKPYSHRLTKAVVEAMRDFTKGECLLVQRDRNTPHCKPMNCHLNVQAQIASFGGRTINGWLLDRSPTFQRIGASHWSFHSIWEAPNGDWLDPTIDRNNNREYSTFWPDHDRRINLVEGLSYNDIVIFESKRALDLLDLSSQSIEPQRVYWTARGFSMFRSHRDHSGRYRYLRDEFPHNLARLKDDYGVRLVNGKLIRDGEGDGFVSSEIFFDYSVS